MIIFKYKESIGRHNEGSNCTLAASDHMVYPPTNGSLPCVDIARNSARLFVGIIPFRTNRHTNRQIPDRCITLTDMDVASVTVRKQNISR